MTVETYKRRFEAIAAFDLRDPAPAEDRGIGGVEFRFSLVGVHEAVSFGISTGWMLPSVVGLGPEWEESSTEYRRALAAWDRHPGLNPLPMGMFFHCDSPIKEHMREQEPRPCDLVASGSCWSDVTYIGADRPLFALIAGGTDGLWAALERELAAFVTGDE